MKIVIVGPTYPFRGGIAQYGQVLCLRLNQAGHDAIMVSFKRQFPRLIFPGKTQMDPSQERLLVTTYPIFAPLSPISWWQSYRRIKQAQPDVVLFNWFNPFFAPGFWAVSRLVRWGTKARIIYILHNVIPHENLPCSRFLTRLALRTADAYVTHARAVEQDLLQWLPKVKPEQISVGGLGEAVESGISGFVVPPETPKAIVGAEEKFYAAGGQPAFHEGVLRQRSKYSWEGIIKTIENLVLK